MPRPSISCDHLHPAFGGLFRQSLGGSLFALSHLIVYNLLLRTVRPFYRMAFLPSRS